MTAEETTPGNDPVNNPDTQEPPTAPNAAPSGPPLAEPPALNRAERRAQAQGKKSATGGSAMANRAGNARFSGNKPAADKTRFPRTGHK